MIGRDRYGVFPLRGKILNVREASHKQVHIQLHFYEIVGVTIHKFNTNVLSTIFLVAQIMENAEINNIIKIVGLQYKKSYDDAESLKTLRYGKIMIMTDQVG